MKIYLFNPENGLYLGEDFADEAPIKRGNWVIPAGATPIAPPPAEQGEIAVFDPDNECWEVRRCSRTDR